ncbi:MAG TPA: trigger factor [Gammaproteobacteria bacterium]|nr:trigger factor [Gammaproteobacteria bacterium]
MQVSVDNVGVLGRKVHVVVPETDVATAIRSRLTTLSQQTQMDGFRRGKVPLKLVEQRFGGQVRQEVVGELLRRHFVEACQQHNLRPAGDPAIAELSAEPGEGMRFTAEFEVYPELQLAPFATLSLERFQCEISDSDLDAMTQTLREQRAEWREVERPAVDGDRLTVDFVGTLEGVPFEGGTATGINVVLGRPGFIPGFAEGLVGAGAGQTIGLDLSFPEGYQNAELAGKPVHFEVTVKAVREPILPEVDDAFFAAFDVREGGLEVFRRELRSNLERERDQLLRERNRKQAFDRLMAANEFEVPRALVAVEAERMLEELRQNLQQRGVDPSNLPALDNLSIFGARAHERVKLALIVSEVVRSHGLRPDPVRVRELVERTASSYQDPQAVVRWFFEDRNRLADVEAAALEDGVVEWLWERASVTEVCVDFDELRRPPAATEASVGADT